MYATLFFINKTFFPARKRSHIAVSFTELNLFKTLLSSRASLISQKSIPILVEAGGNFSRISPSVNYEAKLTLLHKTIAAFTK